MMYDYDALLSTFEHHPLSTGAQDQVAVTRQAFADLAGALVVNLPHGPELTRALVLLRQAKDAAVIAVVQQDALDRQVQGQVVFTGEDDDG